MKNRIATLLSAVIVVITFQVAVGPSEVSAATQQSITLLGGHTDSTHPWGGYSQEADVSWDTGTSWVPAYLTNSHPWTKVGDYPTGDPHAGITDSYLSGCPRTDDAACLNHNFIFRHRFYIASDFETATISYQMNVDDIGQFFLNGLDPGNGVNSGNQLFSPFTGNNRVWRSATNQNVQSLLQPGWNSFYVVLTGLSGHVGINYWVTLNYNSVAAPVYAAPSGKPGAPTIGTPTIVDSTTVSVPFTPPASDGGSLITSYRVTSYPHGKSGTSASSPISISGLSTGSPETFTVVAITAFGTSDSSTASVAITPRDRFTVTFNTQGGSSISSASYFTNESVTTPSSPTMSGYSFNGWFESTTAGSQVSFPYSNSSLGNFTLYSQWTLLPVIATNPSPVVAGPPPSVFVVLASPKISRTNDSYICTSGSYAFKRQGGAEEVSKISSQQIRLLSNGRVVDSGKSLEVRSTFVSNPSYKGTTMSCEIGINQEGIEQNISSLNSKAIADLETAKTAEIYGSNNTFYTERDAAYLKRSAGDNTSWKDMLEKAVAKRESSKLQAEINYIANLEKAGISILVALDKTAPDPTPTSTSTPTPETIKTVNVQPAAMIKVGSIYFASGTYFINDEAKKTIKALATSIFMKSPTTVLSYGFTDSKGGTDNTLLSQNRAKAVAKLLRDLLPGQKIVTGWYASSKPVATGTSKAALAQNRRVEIYIK